jgi:hypothetical protein
MQKKLYSYDELTLLLKEYHDSLFTISLKDDELKNIVDHLIKRIYTK